MNLSAQEKKNHGLVKIFALIIAFLLTTPGAFAGESTMPSTYAELIDPSIASQYVYSEDGPFSEASGLPTYQWMPAKGELKSVILAIHGLTLHGRRYRVLARTLAINNIGVVSVDMRGFGRNKFDDNGKEKPKGEKTELNNELSYQDIVKVVQAIKAKYPNIPLIAMGESLGCTYCIRLAGEYPELINGVAISAPAIGVNPKMYSTGSDIKEGVKAILSSNHQVDLKKFLTELVSPMPEIANEMLDDPFIVKALTLKELIAVDFFVEKTLEWSKNTAVHLPLLVIQGSNDKCVLPKHLTDLMMTMRSDDMRICWKGSYGHLQLETAFMRASIIDSLGMWLQDHSADNRVHLKKLEQSIAELGGTLVH